MVKSRAEIQRDYRMRKMLEIGAENWKKKERQRKNLAYKHTIQTTEQELIKRRKEINIRVKTHYQKKKKEKRAILESTGGPSTRTQREGKTKLIVKLPLPKKGVGIKKSYKKSLLKRKIEVSKLNKTNSTLKRENQRLWKRLQRRSSLNASSSSATQEIPDDTMTPKSKTKLQMRETGLTRKSKTIWKPLLFANSLTHSMKDKVSSNVKAKKKSFRSILSSKVVKKYRCGSAIAKATGVGRKTIYNMEIVRKQRKCIKTMYEQIVVDFLTREDNSSMMPGKKDVVKINGEEKQKYILSDYLHNLHEKFCFENPGITICRATFSTFRPRYILLANFASKQTCLCSRHQNFCLKLRAMKTSGFPTTENPDGFVKCQNLESIDALLQVNVTPKIKYSVWEKVQEEGKYRFKLLQKEKDFEDFKEMFKREFAEFEAHVKRVQHQFKEMSELRKDLPEGHALVWMDYAENFTCSSVEQPQSAYWNSAMVTLHTTVAYLPQETKHSIVAVSDEMSHGPDTVYAILKKLVPKLKELYPDLKYIHYLTDSPTSQYRNKSIFKVIAWHSEEFGINCQWDYLEAGHGKGPCDGASVKRSANNAVVQGKVLIQDSKDFYAWTQSDICQSTVNYIFVSKEDVLAASEIMGERSKGLKRVVGTMKIHAVCPISKSKVLSRELTCYCTECKVKPSIACGWKEQALNDDADSECQEISHVTPDNEQDFTVDLLPGKYVAAVYDKKWYIGEIMNVEEEDILIDFMESGCKNGKVPDVFRRPMRPDKVWVQKENILTNVEKPVPSGKSKRLFKISGLNHIEACFSEWLTKNM